MSGIILFKTVFDLCDSKETVLNIGNTGYRLRNMIHENTVWRLDIKAQKKPGVKQTQSL